MDSATIKKGTASAATPFASFGEEDQEKDMQPFLAENGGSCDKRHSEALEFYAATREKLGVLGTRAALLRMADHLRTEHMDYEYIKVPLGGGLYTTVYAVPSGWQYQTGSSNLVFAGAGPISGGIVQGSLVFAVTQGKFASPGRRYRLFFTGYDVSASLGTAAGFGVQASEELTPSSAIGQVYRLPRSGAPMPGSGQRFANNQEAGGPTGFEGDFMMASFDAGRGGTGGSTAIMFLGGARGAPSTWSQHEFVQYKYVTFFSGMWAGNSQGAGYSVIRGSVSPPVPA